MKLVIRQYLESLRERGELDAILPDLLCELGFTVYSRPGIGTKQHGVDIAAVGIDEDGEKKVHLFVVKSGNLTRHEWDNGIQSLRPSLNEVRDSYIPSRIPKRYQNLNIVVCICFGGDVKEQVRDQFNGYITKNTNAQVSYAEWNGDKIAGLLMDGILKERFLAKPLRASFQKSVALLDEPEVSYRHFRALADSLLKIAKGNQKTRIRSARQIYICLWVLYVWARDIDNLEAPYQASELAILYTWELLRPLVGKNNTASKAISTVFRQLVILHLTIVNDYIEKKIFPHTGKLHALSVSIGTRNAVDINLKLFDLLGRIAMSGLWLNWLANLGEKPDNKDTQKTLVHFRSKAMELIQNNPALNLPINDDKTIDIALLLIFSAACDVEQSEIRDWLREMTSRLDFTTRGHGKYTCVHSEYRMLIDHPRTATEAYRKDATSGSTLIPVLAAFHFAMKNEESFSKLAELCQETLEHCTLQLWLPDVGSEEKIYIGMHDHGESLTDLKLTEGGENLLEIIGKACERNSAVSELSAMRAGNWPIVLLACRHHRIPVPPHFWIHLLQVDNSNENSPLDDGEDEGDA